MRELNPEEQKVLVYFEDRASEIKYWKAKRLREEITSRLLKIGNYTEVWHARRSAEAVFETLQTKIWYGDLTEEQVEYIKSWSWVAFFGGGIWTLGSKLYLLTIGYFIPIYNISLIFYLGRIGRRLSWQQGWQDFNEFRKRQKRLGWFIAILLGISVGAMLFAITLVASRG